MLPPLQVMSWSQSRRNAPSFLLPEKYFPLKFFSLKKVPIPTCLKVRWLRFLVTILDPLCHSGLVLVENTVLFPSLDGEQDSWPSPFLGLLGTNTLELFIPEIASLLCVWNPEAVESWCMLLGVI